jgi:tripartite-type tricarboxylate transporter receptor subunit TctC
MVTTRRSALMGGVGIALARPALAQRYPARPIRFIVPFAAGGGTDVPGRILAEAMGGPLGQTVLVENRTGAGGTIGMEMVVRSPPDGYTVVLASGGAAIIRLIYRNLSYDPVQSLLPISPWFKSDNALLVRADSRLRSMNDLLDAARREPGRVSFGSAGHGSQLHLLGEMLQYLTNIRLTHVPYRGGAQALTDLVAGNVDTVFDSFPSAVPQVRAGSVRALAITGPTRSSFLPDTPTMVEEGITEMRAMSWGGVFAPLGTPPEIIERLSDAIIAAGQRPDVRERMARAFTEVIADRPEGLARMIQEEIRSWSPVIRAANIVAE